MIKQETTIIPNILQNDLDVSVARQDSVMQQVIISISMIAGNREIALRRKLTEKEYIRIMRNEMRYLKHSALGYPHTAMADCARRQYEYLATFMQGKEVEAGMIDVLVRGAYEQKLDKKNYNYHTLLTIALNAVADKASPERIVDYVHSYIKYCLSEVPGYREYALRSLVY